MRCWRRFELATPRTAAILATAVAGEDLAARARADAGVLFLLEKPWRNGALQELVRQAVYKARGNRVEDPSK